jgi:hypothetical protein
MAAMRSLFLAALVAGLASGCAAPRLAGSGFPDPLGREERCRVGAGTSNPLVTEWPASEKANLEALLRQGAVAVEYTGCSMRVLANCRLGGGYGWQRTTPASEVVEIASEDELYAKLPLGALSLEGELKRTGKLTIHTRVSGQMRLHGASPADVPAAGDCARATHVVSALAVGAFALEGKGTAGASADVSVATYGSFGGKADRSAGIVRASGEWDACRDATDAAPDANCRSPIQVFLWPIPGRAAEDGPAGTVKVDLVSATPSTRWDVYYDDEVICSTPCTRWLDPSRPLLMRAREGAYMTVPERIHVHDLELSSHRGAVQVQAHGTANGKLVTGITFTSFGGMAALAGLALTAVGCGGSSEGGSSGMCTGGLTTLGAGAFVTTGAILLILDALPRAEIRSGGPGRGRSIQVAFGPGFVAGRF